MTKIDKEKCIGCGACASICPEGIKMVDRKAAIVNTQAKCIKETKDICPVGAIK